MPKKSKKKSNNKKGKGSPSSSPGSSSPADISEWAQSGRMDSKGLAKSLPDIAAALRSGELQPNAVPGIVKEATQKHVTEELRNHLPEQEGRKVVRLGTLEIMTGAESVICDLIRIPVGVDTDLSFKFAWYLFGNQRPCPWKNVRETMLPVVEERFMDFRPEMFRLVGEIQRAFNRTCEMLRSDIEKLAKKSLEEHCWPYNKTLTEFMGVLAQLVERSDNYSLDHLVEDMVHTQGIKLDRKIKAAAEGIQDGHDKIRHVCWECGNNSVPVAKCAACQAARYCSQNCQRKSWKEGHKQACKELKVMYKNFMANCRCIDQALEQQDKESPLGPNGRILPPAGTKDYNLLPFLLSNYTFPVTLNVDTVSALTSMDNLYKNLQDIVNGRPHWMFEDCFSTTVRDYVDTHVLERANDIEIHYMMQGMLFLTVDMLKISPSSVAIIMVENFRRQLRKTSLDGELMSVTRFIEIYYRFGLAERDGFEKPGARLQNMTQCMNLMIKHFHKHKTPLDIGSLRKEAGIPFE